MKVKFNTSKGRIEGEVVKSNSKTVWVKFEYKKNVAKEGVEAIFKKFTAIIKRHKIKHNLVLIDKFNNY